MKEPKVESSPMTPAELRDRLRQGALAFRGYNVTNLGRSRELLIHPVYGETVRRHLEQGSSTCTEMVGRPIDLVARILREEETTLETYDEAIGVIMAMEMAQLELLQRHFDIAHTQARLSLGYSLGELTALVAGGVFSLADTMRIPLAMAADCAALAHDVVLGVVFSRGQTLAVQRVHEFCLHLNAEGHGVIGVSAYLSPNSLLIVGNGDTVDRFVKRQAEWLGKGVHVRKNQNRWPPLHTPLVWRHNIPNRAAHMMHTLAGGFRAPHPPVLSLVTGTLAYNDYNAREILARWVDHPQRLWDVVYETLAMGIETIVHVGPEPNIVPATYSRLAVDVSAQIQASRRMQALSAATRRPWLMNLLPKRAALLRAPIVRQVVLEDWLLEHAPR